jgi:alpha-L-rhamnosidase
VKTAEGRKGRPHHARRSAGAADPGARARPDLQGRRAATTVADLGQNMVGWVRLKVQGPAGTTLTLRHAEVLDKDGNFYTANLRKAKATLQYTLKGAGVETFEPHFTFFGFRYVAVAGFPGELTKDALTGIVVHSQMRPAGEFETSKPLVNLLQHNIVWGQKGNFLDVPTDCPQRDERLGWTGDAEVFFPTAAYKHGRRHRSSRSG